MQIASPQLRARRLRHGGTIAALSASLLLGACGQTLNSGSETLSLNATDRGAPGKGQQVAQSNVPPPAAGLSEDLLKATDYWGKAYSKNPRDLKIALSYARNLKAMGEKRRALAVLQQSSLYNGQDRELASEYGRLALDLDQVAVAKQLLAIADDPARPDWKVISARGAALAKEGNYNEAIPYFERARALSQDQPSVMSNLALAYAMNGEPAKAESMLRTAAQTDNSSPRIRQNLALVLGLQGKYDEAKLIAARDIPMTNASENADYLRQVVKLDPKSVPNSGSETWDTESKTVAELPVMNAVPVEKVARMSGSAPSDPAAANDSGWVVGSVPAAAPAKVATSGKRGAKPDDNIMSVSEMAAQFGAAEDATGNGAAWSSQVAHAKR